MARPHAPRTRVSTYLSAWMPTGDETFSISGGQETVTVGGYTYVVFTSSGTATVNNLSGSATVGICTIGAGGGGGYDIAGGGGGGELDLFSNFSISGNLTIAVGAGGTFPTTSAGIGSNGGTSTVSEGATTLQSALGGGGGKGGSGAGATGGSGGGGSYNAGAGGGASGSNTFAGGTGFSGTPNYGGGGGGGATAVGLGSTNPTGGQGYALTSIDANLTSANFPTTLTGKTYVSSGGGGAYYSPGNTSGPQAGGTNAGTGEYYSGGAIRTIPATSPTSYGCGGAGGGGFSIGFGTAGFDGLVILRYT